MNLTFRDGIAAILGFGVLGFTVAILKGIPLPLTFSYRGAMLVLIVLGLLMCILGSYGSPLPAQPTGMMRIAAILGGLAFLIFIVGLVTGNKWVFVLLSIDIVSLWCLTTFRRFLGI